ncbi:epidermal growth factor receptor substrate 15 [Microdochium nivale]|nr:epidermal growth factor receptor substrate 15 [Microdochium nivale]
MSASGSSAPGRLSAANTGDSTSASYRTALRGASLAFQRTGPPSRQPGAANDGFTAASTLSPPSTMLQHSLTGQRSPPRLRSGQVSRNTTGNSHASTSVGIANGSHHHDLDHGPFTPQRQSHVSQALTPSHGATLLAPPGKSPATDAKSTSFIAATLAASRSNSPISRQPQTHMLAQQTPRNRRMNSTDAPGGSAASSSLSLVSNPDESSIPRTTDLISMFEKKDDGGTLDDNTDPVKKQTPSRQSAQQTISLAARTTLRPHTPPRATSPVLSSSVSPSRQASTIAWQTSPGRQAATERLSPSARYSGASQARKQPPAPPPVRSRTVNLRGNTETMSGREPAEQRAIKARPITPPPRTISRSQTVIVSPQPKRITSQTLLSKDPPGQQEPVMKSKPVAIPPRPKVQQVPQKQISPGRPRAPLSIKPNMNAAKATSKSFRKSSMVSNSSNDTFVSASSAPSPGPESPRRRFRPPSPSPPRVGRPASAGGAAPRQHWQKPTQPGPRHRASDAALNSLTSAIVAGSLASARATPTMSKAKTPPTPPPRKPTPRLKKTLRQPPTKSDDEGAEQRYKKHRIRSNKKHSHHEGSRKRWRDEITARERKRYEGVWASNRGRLLLPQQQQQLHPADAVTAASDADSIANVVARDIWSRSRLPSDELAEVWDLVDTTGRGTLGRTEFVVGMWLIDQRLRGRKIPQKVGDSVWGSAKGFEVVVGHPSRSGKKHKRGG